MGLHLFCGKDLLQFKGDYQQFKKVPHGPSVQTRVYREQVPPARERGGTLRGNLWFYLPEHGEDMRKGVGKPTSALAAQVVS